MASIPQAGVVGKAEPAAPRGLVDPDNRGRAAHPPADGGDDRRPGVSARDGP